MTTCPEGGCKGRVDEMHSAIFKDAEGGCRFDIRHIKLKLVEICGKTISKRVIIILLIAIGIPAYVAFINVWADDKVTAEKLKVIQQLSVKVERNVEVDIDQGQRVIRLEEQFRQVDRSMEELKTQQRDNTKEIIMTIKRFSNNHNP